jgi:4-hydroxybenzoate polyprenyltransferase
VSAGLADGPPLPSRITADFSRFPERAIIWSLVLLALFAFGFFVVAFRTGALRDKEPAGDDVKDDLQRAYSLSRVQAALWLVVVVYVYVVIFASTGEFNGVVPESVLGLLGISAGTFISGVLIDRNRVRAKTADQRKVDQEFTRRGTTNDEDLAREWKQLEDERTVSKTEGFWKDILNNANGTGLHRLQLLVWTFIMLGVFIIYTWRTFSMADFDSTMLGLLGISAAAFAGTKTAESKKSE